MRPNIVSRKLYLLRHPFWAIFNKAVSKRIGHRVAAGPFEGMKYTSSSVGSAYHPKIFGIYEMELRPVIGQILQKGFDVVVNVGGGEGYYAVGLALRMPALEVIVFEMAEEGRLRILEIAESNGVSDRVHIKGWCDSTGLESALERSTRKCLVVMDVEGAEKELLNPTSVPQLRSAYILVEVHDFLDESIGDEIRKRFCASHDFKEIRPKKRLMADLPKGFLPWPLLPPTCLARSIDEKRPEKLMWFYMTPREVLLP